MRAARIVIIAIVALSLAAGFASIADAGKKKLDGQELYKEFCKPCHTADSEAGEVTPMTLIQDQWNRFFDEKFEETHGTVLDPGHDNKPVTEAIGEDELEAIRDFAVDHAADSEHPMTCG